MVVLEHKSSNINLLSVQNWIMSVYENNKLNEYQLIEILWILLSLKKIDESDIINNKINEILGFISSNYSEEVLIEKTNTNVLIEIIELIDVEKHSIFLGIKKRIKNFILATEIDNKTDIQLMLLSTYFNLVTPKQIENYILTNKREYSQLLFLSRDELDIQLSIIELEKNLNVDNQKEYLYLLSGLILTESKNYNLYEVTRLLRLMRILKYPTKFLLDGVSFLKFQQRINGPFGLTNYKNNNLNNTSNLEYNLSITGVILSELKHHL